MGREKQLRFIAVGNQLYQPSFYLSHAYRDPTIPTTQYGGLCHVTLYHTYPLRSNHQASRTFSGDKKTGDSSRTNPPLACNTQQYAAQITLIQNTNMHLGAITCPRRFPPHRPPSWTTPQCPWNPRWCGRDCCRRTHTPPAASHPRSTAVSMR